jgi:hypothetical protein
VLRAIGRPPCDDPSVGFAECLRGTHRSILSPQAPRVRKRNIQRRQDWRQQASLALRARVSGEVCHTDHRIVVSGSSRGA